MKNTIKISFILIIIYSFINQSDNPSYFDYIYKAEKAVIKNDYENALTIYKDLFNIYETPRACDYYNASLCAAFLGKEDILFEYLTETIKRGFKIEFIENPLILNSKISNKEWTNFKNKYNLYLNEFKSKQNNPVISELKKMYEKDQDYSYMLLMNEIDQIELDSLYYSNMSRLVELIKRDSIPSIESFNLNSKRLRSIFPFVLIRHYYGMLNRALYYPDEYHGEFYNKVIDNNVKIEEQLIKLIEVGRLSPTLISESITYNNPNDPIGKLGKNYGRYIVTEDNKHIVVEIVMTKESYTDEEIKVVNKNRKKWNLPDFNHSLELTKYSNQISDSIKQFHHKNKISEFFNLTGELLANEYYLDDIDSLTFHKNCEKNLKGKFGYELEWIYLGLEKGWEIHSD